MRFQKINENVIRCIITQEEMRMQGINIDDLMGDRLKAESFLQYVLSQAKYEVDFVTNGDVLNVQLSVMKGGEVSMMISDDQNATIRALAEQFKNKLREFSKTLEEEKGKLTSGQSTEKVVTKESSRDSIISSFIDEGDTGEVCNFTFWARLSSVDDCISMAKALSDIGDAPSDLYKYYGEYYLTTSLEMSRDEIAKYVFIMSEYSDDVSSENMEYLMVSEHGQILVADHAISKLAQL